MIVLDLQCGQSHRFEAWFPSADACQTQLDAGQIACPTCGDRHVRRLPSAPYVQTAAHSAPARAATPSPEAMAARMLAELRAAARQSEDVGTRFPEEARRIHHGEAEERAIRGQANAREMRELLEEGIAVLPVPPEPDDLH